MKQGVWQQALIIALVVMALYSRVADFPFVNYDDNRYFYENPNVTSGLDAGTFQWAFGIHGPSMWIPLTWISHQTMVSLFGTEPAPHHALNVFLHALNACLLLLLLRRMTDQGWRAFAVALLFAIHPLHAESVAWITERKDVLSLAFCLLALLTYERHARSNSWKWFPLVALLHSFAVMAKPLAVTLPCVMLLCDFWPLGRIKTPSGTFFLRALLEKLPLLAISAMASYFTVLCQNSIGAIGSAEMFPPATRAANALVAYATYLRRLIAPVDLAVFYPYPKQLAPTALIGSAVVMISLFSAAWILRRRMPSLPLGLLWFAGTLVPMIGLVQAGSAQMADRYAYFTFIGLYIAFVWLAFDLFANRRKTGLVLATLFCLWLVGLNWRQTGTWKSSEALFSRAVRVTSGNYLAHNNLGLALRDAGRTAEARRHFELSLAADPNYAEARNNLAILEASAGRPAIARKLLEDLVAARPDHATAWHNLGKVLTEAGERERAIAAFRKAISLAPSFTEPRYDLACVLMAGPEKSEANELLVGLLQLAPNHASAWINLGVLRGGAGDTQGAMDAYQRAIAIEPGNATARLNLALLLATPAQADEALRQISLAPGMESSRTRYLLGEAFRKNGAPLHARRQFERALVLDPRNADAHNDLGVVLGEAGDHKSALAHFEQALAIDPKHSRAKINHERARNMMGNP